MNLSQEQILEIERLASLWATARVRKFAFHIGRAPAEKDAGCTEQDMEDRSINAHMALHDYLKELK